MSERLKYSQLRNDKQYRVVNCPYWYSAIFFRQDGRQKYRIGDNVYKTTYEMYAGLTRCEFVEHVEPEVEPAVENKEPSFTFLDDRVDYMLKKKKHEDQMKKYAVDYVPVPDWEYVGMTKKQWDRYLWDRVNRSYN